MTSNLEEDPQAVVSAINLDLPSGKAPRPRKPKRIQVLALSGGGYRGLYGATFFEHVEKHFGCAVSSKFDLIAGTSIGALLGVSLALEIPASVIAGKFIKHGPKIFDRRRMITWTKKTFFTAPYSPKTLEEAIVDTIGRSNAQLSLKAVTKPLAVVAVNYTTGAPYIFRSKGLAGTAATDATVLEAVLASTAAPTYFPPQKVNDQTLIDGGIIANAPEVLAVSEACGTLGWPLRDLYVLGMGTASRRKGAALDTSGSPSTISWMLRRELFQSTLSAQEVLAEAQCRTLLKDRYYRVNREPSEAQAHSVREFDLATKEATKTLQSLAKDSWEEHRSTQSFRSYFLD
ncbi:CBASS cGAMP-activated phospholipase [Tunturiibacter psychrotolerans]|uniref:CBASS cGAMP-activated phospholipase n=1 Tax=Tunturiibacter psychrotolerans TaxID=3069686 RepID=UPI003D199D80